jgi:dipeptidase D
MGELSKLYPQLLWENFEKICSIPHPSKKEEQIIAMMKNYGGSLGLETIVDDIGNVIIKKPASPGMENKKTVILQAHLDMVPQKNADTVHDFEKDPIQAYIDGDWVKAKGTTLGSDNGIGAAAAMAVLASENLVHGPVETLFTIDEETGMTGAFGLKPGLLDGEVLINLDSEDEGELYIGCAGGINTNALFSYKEVPVPGNMVAYKLFVSGLKGGHSGLDIHLGRGNACKILNRYLYHAEKEHGMRLASIDAGSLRNAIPREALAEVVIPADQEEKFVACVKHYYEKVLNEIKTADPAFQFGCEKIAVPDKLIDEQTQKNLIRTVFACLNGVIRMSADMPGVVETSTNLAIVKSEKGSISIITLQRSAVDSAKNYVADAHTCLFELAGAEAEQSGSYPGWKPNPDSPILSTMKEVYNSMYGKVPEVKVIHAGLECGIIGNAYPGLDMISFGPTIRNPHSPDEMVDINTVGKFWDFLIETLKNIPLK